MKSKKISSLLVACLCLGTMAFSACQSGGIASTSSENTQQQEQDTRIEAVYAQYVVYAEQNGQKPMSYEAWLNTIKGADGKDGEDGVDGKSAYEVWLANGYSGTQSDFLEWLKGEKGEQGEQGIQGEKGEQGEQGIQGEKGDQGEQGIQGEKGDQGEQGIQGEKGEQGEQGIQGEKGEQGEQGIQGEKGDQGEQGIQGEKGEQGEQGVGIESITVDENGDLIVTYTGGTTQKIEMPKEEEHVHTFGEWLIFDEDKGLLYRICEVCNSVDWTAVKMVTTKEELVFAGANGGVVSIEQDLVLDTAVRVTKDLTVNLNANIGIPNDTAGNGVFYVGNSSTLTLNGNGTVNGVGDNDWNLAVFAENNAEVIINGGYYTNEGATDSTNPINSHFDLIYVKYGAKVTINGGTFKCETPEYTLNSHDSKAGTFVVKGGEFFEFDPSNVTTEPMASGITSWVAEGYEVVEEVREDGTWYVVQKIQSEADRLATDKETVSNLNAIIATADADLANLDSVEAYVVGLGYAIENYKPVSKNYRLAYASSLKKVILVNDENKIVYPAEYANEFVTVEVVEGDEDKVIIELNTADDIALVAMSRGGEIFIPTAGLNLDTAIYVTKDLTVNLTGNLSIPNDTVGDGVFCVTKGTLTLNGNGTVNGVGNNDYNIAIWANGGNVVINGGTYTNTDREDALDLLYVKYNGTITINGGTFKCAQPQWTLNSHDNQTGTFVVKGGEFYEFNLAEAKTEPGWSVGNYANWVAEGYEVVEEVREDGTWYVVRESKNEIDETIKIESGEELILAAANGGVVSIEKDLVLDTAVYVTKDLTVNLNANIGIPNDTAGNGVFYVGNSSTLTLNGNGTVNGVGNNDWNLVIWADGGEVIINGGTYTNEGAKVTDNTGTLNNNEVIYVKNGGKVIINGGTFIGANTKYVLNSHDTKKGTIEVKGGKFYKFNPETDANDATVYVADGYKVVQDGDWYEVVAE